MKINNKIENIFAHAVALDQSGRLRNTVYCLNNLIFIMNSDNTVLLRFELNENVFEAPVSFRANDYDSKKFYIEGDKIVFETQDEGFVRKKYCGTPEANANDIKNLYEGFPLPNKGTPVATFNKGLLKSINEDLSHIEFSGTESKLKIVQRNIYDGSLIEIFRSASGGLIDIAPDWIPEDFGPIGFRINDFIALYSFHDSIEFSFTPWGWMSLKGLETKLGMVRMEGVVSWCVYDELGILENIVKETEHGRQKSQDGASESKPDRQTRSRRTKKRKSRRTT
jgi:hypothetical protein